MSVEAINWAFTFEAKNSSEKAILLALANFADGEGRCFPGQESIARRASCSDRTVRSILSDLEDRSVIEREERRRKDGTRTSDVILIIPLSKQAANSSASDDDNRKISPKQPENPAGGDGSNRKISSHQPEEFSGLTSFEPPEEPSDSNAAARAREDINREPVPRGSRIEMNVSELTERLLEAAGEMIQPHGAIVVGPILELIAAGVDLETDILPVIRSRCQRLKRPAGSWGYFVGAIRDAYERRVEAGRGIAQPKSPSKRPEDLTEDEQRERWRKRLSYVRGTGIWMTWADGPPPGREGCRAPEDLLQPRDLTRDWIEERRTEAA